MTDPGCCYFGIAPLRRVRLGKSWSNRTQTFDRPFPPKMPKPTAHTGAAQSWLLEFVFHRRAGKTRSRKTPLRCFSLNRSPQLGFGRKNFLTECQKPLPEEA